MGLAIYWVAIFHFLKHSAVTTVEIPILTLKSGVRSNLRLQNGYEKVIYGLLHGLGIVASPLEVIWTHFEAFNLTLFHFLNLTKLEKKVAIIKAIKFHDYRILWGIKFHGFWNSMIYKICKNSAKFMKSNQTVEILWNSMKSNEIFNANNSLAVLGISKC